MDFVSRLYGIAYCYTANEKSQIHIYRKFPKY